MPELPEVEAARKELAKAAEGKTIARLRLIHPSLAKRITPGRLRGLKGKRIVKVERRFTHPLLKKTVRRSKNYHAHDENRSFKVGDAVSIEETRPISKLKRWVVLQAAVKA